MSDAKAPKDTLIEGHDYDGIGELNNPLPRWWLATFYGTIIFAIIYWGYFEVGPGPSHDERLGVAMDKIKSAQATAMEAMANEAIDVDALLADEGSLAVGQAQYTSKCVPCHGTGGEGSVGPNLTDKYWLHSRGDVHGILAAIRSGFPEKGMPAWGPMIPADEQAPLAAYVLSLQGTNPPNPKAPQGQLIE